MRFLAIPILLTASAAFADTLPPDLRPYEKDLPVVRMRTDRDLDLEYLQESQDITIAGLGFSLLPIEVSAEKWKKACEAPCNERQYRRNVYRITGERVVPSANFTLPRRGERITLNIRAGSVAVRNAGWATLAFGLAFLTGGAIAMAVSPEYGPVDAHNPVFVAGLVPASVAFSVLITSIPLLVKSRTVITAEAE